MFSRSLGYIGFFFLGLVISFERGTSAPPQFELLARVPFYSLFFNTSATQTTEFVLDGVCGKERGFETTTLSAQHLLLG